MKSYSVLLSMIALAILQSSLSVRGQHAEPMVKGDSSTYAHAIDMPAVAPLFIESEQFSSVLHLVNDATTQEPATIIVRTNDGSSATTELTIPGHDSVVLPLQTLLKGKIATYGSVELYARDPLGSSLAGQVEITYKGGARRAGIDEELLMPTMLGSQTLRAVSLQSAGSPLVSISNVNSLPTSVTISCVEENGTSARRSVLLDRWATRILRPCSGPESSVTNEELVRTFSAENQGVTKTYGIDITSDSPDRHIEAFGITPHTRAGHAYFSAINFEDPKDQHSARKIYAGIPVGYFRTLEDRFAPTFAFANFSSSDRTIAIEGFTSAGATKSPALSINLTIPARSSKSVTLPAEANDDLLASFITTATGAPDDVVGMLIDRADGDGEKFVVVGKDPKSTLNAGMHPWQIDSGNQALIIIFNHEQQAEDVQLRVGTSGGSVWQKTVTLQPHETFTTTVNALIRDKVKDDHKAILPATLTKGEISWFTADSGLVTGRLMQVDVKDHLVQNFSCYGQIVLCQILATATPTSGNVGIQFHFTSSISTAPPTMVVLACARVPNQAAAQEVATRGT